ncbi:MAG TPA: caspase family protein [Kribbella sp.]
MTGIDFARSRAILVGTGHYTHGLPGMPQAINSLRAMRDLLVGPRCGWPEDRVTVFEDMVEGGGIERQTAALIHDVKDVLLFYYVGHGQLLDGEDLGMALVDTEHDPRMRSSTSWRFNDLHEELKYRCSARVKVVLLDCCFSGLATKYTQGVGMADEVQVATRAQGAYTLTASRASQKARHEQDEDGLTYFTRFFTEVVWEGIPGKGAELSLKDIHEQVAARFLRLDLPDGQIRPEPSTLVVDTAEQLAFARNAKAEEPVSVRPRVPSVPVGLRIRSPKMPSGQNDLASPKDATSSAHHRTRAAPTPVRIERRAPWVDMIRGSVLVAIAFAVIILAEGNVYRALTDWSTPAPWVACGSALLGLLIGQIINWRRYQTSGPLAIDSRGIRWDTGMFDREIRWTWVQRVQLIGNGAGSRIIVWYHPGVRPPKPVRRGPNGSYLLLRPARFYGHGPYQAVNEHIRQALSVFAEDKYIQ